MLKRWVQKNGGRRVCGIFATLRSKHVWESVCCQRFVLSEGCTGCIVLYVRLYEQNGGIDAGGLHGWALWTHRLSNTQETTLNWYIRPEKRHLTALPLGINGTTKWHYLILHRLLWLHAPLNVPSLIWSKCSHCYHQCQLFWPVKFGPFISGMHGCIT